MKRKVNYLVKVSSATEGVCHIATSYTTKVYKAQGVKGRNVETKRLVEI